MLTIHTLSEKVFLTLFAFAFTFTAASHAASCSAPGRLFLNETWRGTAEACFEIDVPQAGIVTFDLSAPGFSSSRPVLSVFDENGAEVPGLWRTPSSSVAAVRSAGTFFVHVDSEDPRVALSTFKLRTGFARYEFRRAGEKAEDDDEAEPDGYPKSLCPVFKAEDDDEAEPDGYPKSSECSALPRWTTKLAETCRRGEVDDFGDTFACAVKASWNREIRGEIANGLGDDEDFFVFETTRFGTVEILSNGPTDVLGELYDRFGHRLASDDGHFRMVRALAPGVYFVRVQGVDTASGVYSLILRQSIQSVSSR